MIRIYTQDMELFCLLPDPVMYRDFGYIAENPYIMLDDRKWEIFSFYPCDSAEMNHISQNDESTELLVCLTQKTVYKDKIAAMEEVKNDCHIAAIMVTDEQDGSSYMIGAAAVD